MLGGEDGGLEEEEEGGDAMPVNREGEEDQWGQWNESWGEIQSRELCGEAKRLREAGRKGEEGILGEEEGGSTQKEAKHERRGGG